VYYKRINAVDGEQSVDEGWQQAGEGLNPSVSVLTVGDLLPLTTYAVKVETINHFGKAEKQFNVTTAEATVPGPPTIRSIANVFANSITLNFGPPTDTGGSAITKYTVYGAVGYPRQIHVGKIRESGPLATLEKVDTASKELSITVGNLQAGTPYCFVISASSTIGEGPCSQLLMDTTKKDLEPWLVVKEQFFSIFSRDLSEEAIKAALTTAGGNIDDALTNLCSAATEEVPPVAATIGAGPSTDNVDEVKGMILSIFGTCDFSDEQIAEALKASNNDVNEASETLINSQFS
jgi:hypothetical protein